MGKKYAPKVQQRRTQRQERKMAQSRSQKQAPSTTSSEDTLEGRAMAQLYNTQHADKLYKKLDTLQKEFYQSIQDNLVTIVDAPAGTGKTTVGYGMAGLDLLRRGIVYKLVYLRFPDEEGEKLGFTPGELWEKEAKYMIPAYDALAECGLQPEAITVLKSMKILTMTTDATLRGVNLKGVFLFMDECQNGNIPNIQKVLTRVHDAHGRVVMAGHSGQCDIKKLPKYGKDKLLPFQVYKMHMAKKKFTKPCTLINNYRGEISQWADCINETVKELEGNGVQPQNG